MPRRLARIALVSLAACVCGVSARAQQCENTCPQRLVGGGPPDALDPRDPPFCACPDDGVDDREALQNWIVEGCKSGNKLLYLPPGDWHVKRRTEGSPKNIGSLQVECDGLTIVGAGRESRIVMLGTAKLREDSKGPADWRALEIIARGVTVENIALDGSQRVDTGEQTHLIHITGPARDIELRRLYLHLPVLPKPEGSVKCKPKDEDRDFNTRECKLGDRTVLCKDLGDSPLCSKDGEKYTVMGWFGGGDCIRSVGEAGKAVDGVSITDSYAAECDRSFVALQRDSFNFTITGNVTRKVNDQVVDQEPSGGGIGKVIIKGNRFGRGPDAQGPFAIVLGGDGPGNELADAMVVSDNILDGGVEAFNAARVSIEHNIISGKPAAANTEPVVRVRKHSDGVRVVGNDISRPSGSHFGPVVVVDTHGSGRPTDVTVALNNIVQNTDAPLIVLEGARGVSIVDNTLRCHQPSSTVEPAIKGTAVANLIVSQNRARGACRSLLELRAQVGAVTVTENQTCGSGLGKKRGFRLGVSFEGQLPTVRPRISDNLFEGTPPAGFVSGPPGLTFDGSNGPPLTAPPRACP